MLPCFFVFAVFLSCDLPVCWCGYIVVYCLLVWGSFILSYFGGGRSSFFPCSNQNCSYVSLCYPFLIIFPLSSIYRYFCFLCVFPLLFYFILFRISSNFPFYSPFHSLTQTEILVCHLT